MAVFALQVEIKAGVRDGQQGGAGREVWLHSHRGRSTGGVLGGSSKAAVAGQAWVPGRGCSWAVDRLASRAYREDAAAEGAPCSEAQPILLVQRSILRLHSIQEQVTTTVSREQKCDDCYGMPQSLDQSLNSKKTCRRLQAAIIKRQATLLHDHVAHHLPALAKLTSTRSLLNRLYCGCSIAGPMKLRRSATCIREQQFSSTYTPVPPVPVFPRFCPSTSPSPVKHRGQPRPAGLLDVSQAVRQTARSLTPQASSICAAVHSLVPQ